MPKSTSYPPIPADFDATNPRAVFDHFMHGFERTPRNMRSSQQPSERLLDYIIACDSETMSESFFRRSDPVAVTNLFLQEFPSIQPSRILDRSGTSLLHAACHVGAQSPGVLNAMLSRAVDAEQLKQRDSPYKLTPLQTAAQFAPLESTRRLLAAGAPVTGYADSELSPLGIATLRQLQDTSPVSSAAGRDIAAALTAAGMRPTLEDLRAMPHAELEPQRQDVQRREAALQKEVMAAHAAQADLSVRVKAFADFARQRFGPDRREAAPAAAAFAGPAAAAAPAPVARSLLPIPPKALPGEDSPTTGHPAAGGRVASSAGPAPVPATERTGLLGRGAGAAGAGAAGPGYGAASGRPDWRAVLASVPAIKALPGEGPAPAGPGRAPGPPGGP